MLTTEQKILRRGKIGGSLMTAIAGVNPWMSKADAWHVLTGNVDDAAANAATEAGNDLEAPVLNWLERSVGAKLERDVFLADPDQLLCGNLDGICFDAPVPFIAEAKTTGIVGPADGAYQDPHQGDDHSPFVPERVTVQVHHYMGRVDRAFPDRPRIALALVPVLIGGQGYRLYRIPRNDELVDVLHDIAHEFIDKNVKLGLCPDDSKPSIEILKRIRREPNKVVDIPAALLDSYIVANAAKKQACEDAEEAQAALIAALGDAEAGVTETGARVTYFTQRRKGYTVNDCEFRVLRLPKK